MRTLCRLLLWCACMGGLACLGFVLLFAGYGISQGYDIASGFRHLAATGAQLTAAPAVFEDVPWQRISWVADIETRALNESSGLAASNLHEGVLWSVNDSGSEPLLYAIGLDGRDIGTWHVEVPNAVDWESMDAFEWRGVSYLIIGDTGDNFRWRPSVHFVVVREPLELTPPQDLTVEWRVDFSYPDGPRDSEALAVDTRGERVLFLSKRRYPPELFSVPLHAEAGAVAEKISDLAHFPLPTYREMEEDDGKTYRHTPVGMDLAGERLLIATYKHAYVYPLLRLQAAPLRIRMPSIGQREAITFARGADDVAYVSRERFKGRGVADLFKVEFALHESARTPPAETADVQ